MAAQIISFIKKPTIHTINSQMMDLYFEKGWSVERIAEDPRFDRAPETVEALIRIERRQGRVESDDID